ncbi:hypothetical protein VSVS12_04593 (plasmid) [Vibrio scophthalmi]|uniref:hypothetical protein n=1 Tax=Vibrio scophthalmi TaxID=45658 RepID=UPI0008096920|nr:hypothetical protein [Vibrio scophthalmi]ANS88291.1 hypothetical protein VSVS12_04593 [Vibrio scophthalmi]
MSEQSFLCTYSVKTRDKSTYEEERQAQANADNIRRDIRNVDGWETIDGIETTITGSLYLSGTITQKRAVAKDTIKSKMREIVDEYDAYCDVDIECAFMVDGLGETITFSI